MSTERGNGGWGQGRSGRGKKRSVLAISDSFDNEDFALLLDSIRLKIDLIANRSRD